MLAGFGMPAMCMALAAVAPLLEYFALRVLLTSARILAAACVAAVPCGGTRMRPLPPPQAALTLEEKQANDNDLIT